MKTTPGHTPRTTALSLGLVALMATGASLAGDNPGAHRHGYGQLQMAIQGDQIDLLLTSPAANLVGFERQARSPEEKARLEDVSEWLGSHPLVDTVPGSCVVTAGAVHHTGHAKTPDKNHDHDHHHAPDEESHREYEISQQLACKALTADQAFSSPLKEKFPGLEVLTVEWVGEAGQGSIRLDQGESTFRLGK